MRQHHFSQDQLNPPTGSYVLIASIFVERAVGGLSLGELIDEVRQQVSVVPELVSGVDRVAFESLGKSWQTALEDRFDYELASDSLVFFSSLDVPKVPLPLPPGVTEVRFRADLTHVPQTDANWMLQAGGLFSSVLRE